MFKKSDINKIVSKTLIVMLFVYGLFLPLGCLASESEENEKGMMVCEDERPSKLYDYELFKVVQRVCDIVDEEIVKAQQYGVCEESLREHSSYNCQMQKGLILVPNSRLWTPWGTVRLGVSIFGPIVVLKQAILKRFTTRFLGIDKRAVDLHGESEIPSIKYPVLKSSSVHLTAELVDGDYNRHPRNLFAEMTEEELDSKKGEDIFVDTNRLGYEPFYALDEIDGYRLPNPEWLELRSFAKRDEVESAWREMQKRYDEEHPENLQHLSEAALDDVQKPSQESF